MSTWFDSVDDENTNDSANEIEETTNNEETTEMTEETNVNTGETAATTEEPKKKRTRQRDPNKAPIPPVEKSVAVEIVKLWAEHSKDEIAVMLSIMPEQVQATVQKIKANYKKKIEQATEIGDTATAEKLQKLLDTKLAPKPKGKGAGRPNIADEIMDDLLSML